MSLFTLLKIFIATDHQNRLILCRPLDNKILLRPDVCYPHRRLTKEIEAHICSDIRAEEGTVLLARIAGRRRRSGEIFNQHKLQARCGSLDRSAPDAKEQRK